MKTQLIPVSQLSARDRAAMYDLLKTHFEGVQPEIFERDLSEKNWVLLIKDNQTEQLKGFSTLLMYNLRVREDTISVVYSGDTIVDPSAWSSSALSRSWIAAVNQLRVEFALGKLYWLLVSSGYRTYRFLPVFWQEFYPRYNVPTPPEMQDLIDRLARSRFGRCYDENTGVVRFLHPQRLKGQLKGIPDERLQDPHVRFFAEKNSGYNWGDELVCLTEVCEENLTKAGRRMWFSDRNFNPQFSTIGNS